MTLVIGVGNTLRSDDGLGVRVAEEIQKLKLKDVEVLTSRGENIDLLTLWKGYRRVVILDAMESHSKEPVKVFFAHAEPLPAAFEKTSTHGMGPLECIELARALGELPPYLAVIGIAGKNFEIGESLTEKATQAIPKAIQIFSTLLGGTHA